MKLRAIFDLFKEVVIGWSQDRGPMLAAALAYYTTFSLAPLLVIAVAVAELVFSEGEVQQQLVGQIERMVSLEVAQTVKVIIESSSQSTSGLAVTIISALLLLIGASGVFRQLKIALNVVWGIAPGPGQGHIALIRRELLSFAMVLVIGFFLLLSVAISITLAILSRYVIALLPGIGQLLPVVDFVVSLAIVTFLFAMIFKVLPDAYVAWRDVWLGAAFTALLFTLAKYLISLFLANWKVGAAYNAASSFVVLLFWVYLSGQIFLFGAEFTQAYANKYGSRFVPASYAVLVRTSRYEPPQPEPAPVEVIEPPAPDPPQRQWEKQVAAAFIGLATGLLIAFWGSLKRNR